MENEEPKIEPIHYEATLPAKLGLAGHIWEWRGGPFIRCTSCPFEHHQHIPPNMKYIGLDANGYPILEPVK